MINVKKMIGNLFKQSGKNYAAPTNGNYQNGNSHLIELHHVEKQYDTAAGPFMALDGIDLKVDRGEFLVVVEER